MSSIVKPKNAASLIIYRQARGELEVLMGCRNRKARFKPGVYVFPGGMIERSDNFVKPATKLSGRFAAKMGVANSKPRAQALAMGAIRETFEEVGLYLGATVNFSASPHPHWHAFQERRLAPHLSPLDYIGRAITPSHQPIRFDARFFSVGFENVDGDLKDNGELTDLRWIKLSKRDDFNMMKVTHLMLDTLNERLAKPNTKAPFLYFNKRRPILRWT